MTKKFKTTRTGPKTGALLRSEAHAAAAQKRQAQARPSKKEG